MGYHQERQHSKMPFGKHKGKWTKDVPTDYLKWLVLNLKDQASATYFAEELTYREPKLKKPIKTSVGS